MKWLHTLRFPNVPPVISRFSFTNFFILFIFTDSCVKIKSRLSREAYFCYGSDVQLRYAIFTCYPDYRLSYCFDNCVIYFIRYSIEIQLKAARCILKKRRNLRDIYAATLIFFGTRTCREQATSIRHCDALVHERAFTSVRDTKEAAIVKQKSYYRLVRS